MIVQACINGARPAGFHPALPQTPEAMALDAAACIAAGAAEIHLHPRAPDGGESLAAVDATMAAVRRLCPGTLVGVSTGAWIEADRRRTLDAISGWRTPPDYASVNLSEPDAPEVMQALRHAGVGIEAGLATVADARRLVDLADGRRCLRILIEIDQQDVRQARQTAFEIAAILDAAAWLRPILLHGFDATVWSFVEIAHARLWSTRIGLEDGQHLPDGRVAPDNAALVMAAARIYRGC